MVRDTTHNILSEDESKSLPTPTSKNQMMIGEKASCKDEKSKKACQKLKEKNKGKGCKKKSTMKKCKKTCGLCDDGNLFLNQIVLS